MSELRRDAVLENGPKDIELVLEYLIVKNLSNCAIITTIYELGAVSLSNGVCVFV